MRGSRGIWWLSGAALLVALSAWLLVDRGTQDPAAASFTSLAVLPFDSQSTDAERAHLASGLSLDLHLRLQVLAGVQCTPRSQVSIWQDGDLTREVLARHLGAEILVLGAVRYDSDRVFLSLQIEDARDQRRLTSIELVEPRERIFDLQRQAAIEVVAALRIPVHKSERSRFRADPTRSLKAWDYFTQGQTYLEDRIHPRGPDFAADLFRRAIQHDPDFPQAQVGLIEALWRGHLRHDNSQVLAEAELEARGVLNRYPQMSPAAVILTKVRLTRARAVSTPSLPTAEVARLAKPDEALRDVADGMRQIGRLALAEAAWRSAAKLGERLWLNSYCLGQFLLQSGRYGEAASAFADAAAASPPGMTWPRESLTKLKLASGDIEGAIQVFETFERGPLEIETLRQVAGAYRILGRFPAAERIYRRALDLDPLDPQLRQELGDVLVLLNRPEQAQEQYSRGLETVKRDLERSPADADRQLRLAVFAAKARDCPMALPLAATLRRHLEESASTFLDLTVVFAVCRDLDTAIDTLRIALSHGLPPDLVRSRPELQGLVNEADFQTLVREAEGSPPSP